MILIPHGKKIALIAISLFITTFSVVLFFAGSEHNPEVMVEKNLQTNIFADFFHPGGKFESYMNKDAPVVALDLSGNVIEINTKFSEDFGFVSKEIAEKNFFTLLSADDLPVFASSFSGVSTSGKMLVNAGPFHIMAADGKEHIVLATFDLAKQETSQNKMVVVTLKDITESLIEKGGKPASKSAPRGKSIKELNPSDDESDKNRVIVEKTV